MAVQALFELGVDQVVNVHASVLRAADDVRISHVKANVNRKVLSCMAVVFFELCACCFFL